MPVAKSEFTADLFINVLLNEPYIPLYMGFFVSEVNGGEKDPQLKTSEVTEPAYLRQRVQFSGIDSGFVRLLHDVQFPRASKKWEKVTHFGIFDAERDGNLILLKPTGSVTTVEVGEIIAILANEFQLYVGHNSLLYYGDVA